MTAIFEESCRINRLSTPPVERRVYGRPVCGTAVGGAGRPGASQCRTPRRLPQSVLKHGRRFVLGVAFLALRPTTRSDPSAQASHPSLISKTPVRNVSPQIYIQY